MNTLSKELQDFNFVLQKHLFRIDSDSELHFSILTDNNCGIIFGSNGNSLFTTDGTSTEVVGRTIAPNSDIASKRICAINGDIVLDAKNGDIVLKGMNIRIEGVDGMGGEVTINSSKIVQITSPISNIQGDKFTVATTNSASIAGGYVETHGENSNENSTGTDFLQSSFFGKILSAIKKFKKFFESICGV
jgi:hypothetical protein